MTEEIMKQLLQIRTTLHHEFIYRDSTQINPSSVSLFRKSKGKNNSITLVTFPQPNFGLDSTKKYYAILPAIGSDKVHVDVEIDTVIIDSANLQFKLPRELAHSKCTYLFIGIAIFEENTDKLIMAHYARVRIPGGVGLPTVTETVEQDKPGVESVPLTNKRQREDPDLITIDENEMKEATLDEVTVTITYNIPTYIEYL